MPTTTPRAHAPMRPRGVILAGGGATRFGGRPKGLEPVGGMRILDRLVDVCTEAFGVPPLLVANDPEAPRWRADLTTLPDVTPGMGALGGLLTAVTAGAGAPVVVVAWDMPFVPAPLLRALAEGLATHDAMLPASDGRRGVEPLLAAYAPSCLAPMTRALARGDRRAIAFHDEVKVGILSLDQVRAFGDPARIFMNVNTPDDLTEAEAAWQGRGSVRS